MLKIKSTKLAALGKELLYYVEGGNLIPYVNNGMTLAGMDCQGLVEYLLIESGISAKECNLKGSNAHYRKCDWTGSPEECKAKYGFIPSGAFLFIHEFKSGNEKVRGYMDGLGNASHIGIYLGDCALHASASRKCVAKSKFTGKSIDGGWNMVGLSPWVDYGFEVDKMNAFNPVVGSLHNTELKENTDNVQVLNNKGERQLLRIISPNEYQVKIRESARKDSITKYSAPAGTVCILLGEIGNYYKIEFNGKARYVQKDFAEIVEDKGMM